MAVILYVRTARMIGTKATTRVEPGLQLSLKPRKQAGNNRIRFKKLFDLN